MNAERGLQSPFPPLPPSARACDCASIVHALFALLHSAGPSTRNSQAAAAAARGKPSVAQPSRLSHNRPLLRLRGWLSGSRHAAVRQPSASRQTAARKPSGQCTKSDAPPPPPRARRQASRTRSTPARPWCPPTASRRRPPSPSPSARGSSPPSPPSTAPPPPPPPASSASAPRRRTRGPPPPPHRELDVLGPKYFK